MPLQASCGSLDFHFHGWLPPYCATCPPSTAAIQAPLDFTSAAGKQTTIHSPDIFHHHRLEQPLNPLWRIIIQHPVNLSLTSSTSTNFSNSPPLLFQSSRFPHVSVSLLTKVPVAQLIHCINKPHLPDSSSPESLFCMWVRNISKTMTI
ncbi:hypothetical protein ATANTOWER_017297 [Ataeniobius toweri]|uniref:Uncharacterized protein n=1 Tax=Ataeniobius toweri TaxID=208326 RepID=A0ABU7C2D8_9TELE|nr:hypothetical protein [Ataeniobius toweri]